MSSDRIAKEDYVDALEASLLTPDNSTLEQSGGNIRIKDGGVTAAKLAAGAGGIALEPGYVTGQYYTGLCFPNGGGTGANAVNRQFFIPFIVYVTHTFDRIAVYITANATSGGVMRMGIYNDNSGVPGTVLLDAGTVAVDAGAAAIKAITISQQLTPNRYWLSCVAQTAAPTVQRAQALGPMQWLNATFNAQGLILDSVTGSLGNNPAVSSAAVNPTVVALRA